MDKAVFIGYGYVAQHVVQLELAQQRSVSALSRQSNKVEALLRQGIRCELGDLDGQYDLDALLSPGCGVYYFAPPSPQGRKDERLRGVLQKAKAAQIKRIVYISTTGVYGDPGHDGLITEDAPAQPSLERSVRRLDAECALWEWSDANPDCELVILRVVGIYGPDKLPLERIKRGEPLLEPSEPSYVNLIHVDDLAQACYRAMHHSESQQVYNVSDGYPLLMTHYFQAIASAYHLPQPPLITMKEAEATLSPGFMSYLKESKRIDNTKMLNQLGICLRYSSALAFLDSVAVNVNV